MHLARSSWLLAAAREATDEPQLQLTAGAASTGGTGGGAYRPGNDVSWPRLVFEKKPNYTADAMRAKVQGTATRPRLSVFRSNRGIQAQLIDDVQGHTLAAVNWVEGDLKSLARMEQAKRAGERL